MAVVYLLRSVALRISARHERPAVCDQRSVSRPGRDDCGSGSGLTRREAKMQNEYGLIHAASRAGCSGAARWLPLVARLAGLRRASRLVRSYSTPDSSGVRSASTRSSGGVRPAARTRNRTGVACGENVFTFTLTVARLISGDRTATHWTQTLWLWLPLVILCQRACDCGCCHRRLTADWRLSSKWRCRASSLCRLALGAASGESGSSGPISCCMRCWCAALSASNFSRSRRV